MDEPNESGTDASGPKRIELTREELYELVWTIPMQRLAERYGISGVALAKTCRKLIIPVPSRGYWRRKETGRAPERAPLPRPRPQTSLSVTLRLDRKREAPPPPSPEVATWMAREALPENRIRVADRLTRPHPLVREARAILHPRSRRIDPDRPWHIEPCLDIRVTPKLLDRALRIFDALIKALAERDIPLRVLPDERRQRRTEIELFGEKVPFWLEERTAVVPRVASKEDGKAATAWRRKWNHVPSGQLRFSVDTHVTVSRRAWSDGPRARLEDQLNDVVVGLVAVADDLRARTLYWKRQREAEEEACRQRALAEQRRQEEEGRVRVLEQQVDDWARAAQVRAFADEAERRASAKGVVTAPGSELGEWLVWARRHADHLDPFKPPPPSSNA